MKKMPEEFIKLAEVFIDHGYQVYLIGGSSRDYLLGNEFTDFDVTTDANPNEIKEMFDDVFDKYAIYGAVKVKFMGINFDITTLREESKYVDHRHPSKITYTDDIHKDYQRRDFTINAIYIDKDGNIIDFGSGTIDLKYNLIRTIGDPDKRLKQDPLRILRAIRFSLVLDFEIEESLSYAIARNAHLVSELNPEKIKQEIAKTKKMGIPTLYIKQELRKYHVALPFNIE